MSPRAWALAAGVLLLSGAAALVADATKDRPRVRTDAALPDVMSPRAMAALDIPIDVNTASEPELTSLPGVGPKIAARIIAGRPYTERADLLRVRGIGPARLRRFGARVVIGPGSGD